MRFLCDMGVSLKVTQWLRERKLFWAPKYARWEILVRTRLFSGYAGGTLLASSRRSLRILATLKKIWAPIRG